MYRRLSGVGVKVQQVILCGGGVALAGFVYKWQLIGGWVVTVAANEVEGVAGFPPNEADRLGQCQACL